VQDVLPVQLVTMGERASEHARSLFEKDDYARYLYFHGLSVESTEALAEYWHSVVRRELGISEGDAQERAALFRMQYRGARYSFGYPACPRLEDQEKIMDLLPAREIGVTLTEEYELVPEQSTSAIVCHHPQARYFAV
jgi:5-methyltetrahydrofolate--homocysteine methyltransferase